MNLRPAHIAPVILFQITFYKEKNNEQTVRIRMLTVRR